MAIIETDIKKCIENFDSDVLEHGNSAFYSRQDRTVTVRYWRNKNITPELVLELAPEEFARRLAENSLPRWERLDNGDWIVAGAE